MKVGKNIFVEQEKLKEWEQFCEDNFKTKRVLSKIITEAMDEYIVNFNNLK